MQHIEYAKSKSYATLRHEDPDFVPPTSVHVKNAPNGARLLTNGAGEKRPRGDERMDEDARDVKRERTARDADDSDDEEMEIEDDDEQQQTSGKGQAANGAQRALSFLTRSGAVAHTTPISSDAGQLPAASQQLSARLMCLNLPQEVTDDVLSVLFQQSVKMATAFGCPYSHIGIGTKVSILCPWCHRQHQTRRGRG